MANENVVLQRSAAKTSPRARILCFHHAGGNANIFRQWQQAVPDDVEVVTFHLPGHGTLFAEKALNSVGDIVACVAKGARELFDLPVILFGHSLGGVVAFELAHFARQNFASARISALVAASRMSPSAPRPSPSSAVFSTSDDDQFIELMAQRYGEFPGREVLGDADMRKIFLPPLRADMEAFDTYVNTHSEKLSCPIWIYTGKSDPSMKSDLVELWRDVTVAPVRFAEVEGGHFFWFKDPKTFVERMFGDLKSAGVV